MKRTIVCWLFVLMIALLARGCVVAGIVAKSIPVLVPPKYAGLAGQRVAVMVWADRGLRIDWQSIQLDMASAIQNVLIEYQTFGKSKELEGTQFPFDPRSVVRYQLDHPEIEALPVTDFAPNLGVSRLIYVEIEQFSTRSEMSIDMYRGSCVATLRVIEITGTTARVAYEENDIRAIYPRNARPEGDPRGRDDLMYSGTIRTLAAEIGKRLVTYEEE